MYDWEMPLGLFYLLVEATILIDCLHSWRYPFNTPNLQKKKEKKNTPFTIHHLVAYSFIHKSTRF